MTTETQSTQRTRTGVVTSDKMQNTIVVTETYKVKHKQYRKYIEKSTKYHVDIKSGLAKIGDVVRIAQSRPISKTKCWTFVENLSQNHNVTSES